MAPVVALVVAWAFVAGRSPGRDPRQVRSALLRKPALAFELPPWTAAPSTPPIGEAAW